jgi:hypothetical protein
MGSGYMSYTPHQIDRVCTQTKLSRFATHYSFPPETVAAVLNDNPDIDPKEFYMTLHWWKKYDEEYAMESRWHWHPDTIRHKLYKVCGQLAERKNNKIVFGNFEEDQIFLSNIDCVHCEWQDTTIEFWYSIPTIIILIGIQSGHNYCLNTVGL